MNTPLEMRKLLDTYRDRTVVHLSSLYNEYKATSTQFAYVNAEVRNDVLHLEKLVTWFGCRGYMCEALFGVYNNNLFTYSYDNYDIYNDIHGKTACMFMQNIRKNHLEAGMRVLNEIEEKAGWDKSFFEEYSYKSGTRDVPAFLWVGDKRWFKATIYLSLLLLVIRTFDKVPINNEESFSDYIRRAGNLPGGCTSYTDKKALEAIAGKLSNLTEVLMAEQDFITEELDYHEERKRVQQVVAHDAGIHYFTDCVLKFLDTSLRTKENEMSLLRALNMYGPLHQIHKTLFLRTIVALQEYGIKSL